MRIPKGPTEGGSGGKRGHYNMEHWGYASEVKQAARKYRQMEDRRIAVKEMDQHADTEEERGDNTAR